MTTRICAAAFCSAHQLRTLAHLHVEDSPRGTGTTWVSTTDDDRPNGRYGIQLNFKAPHPRLYPKRKGAKSYGKGPSLMARVNVLLEAFHRITKRRQALESIKHRLADRERQLVGDIGRALSDLGYRLERIDEIQAALPARRTRWRRTRQDLKCPKCERRFFLQMHVARHLNAMHTTKNRAVKRAAA
jgi:uncharacterized C2H2 Zn-finger protein